MTRRAIVLAVLVCASPASSQALSSPGGDVMALVRTDRWADAEQAVAGIADPVARKLVTYFRLLSPAAANATEIDGFMEQNPDWPNQAGLARRREEALAVEPDDSTAAALCGRITPHGAGALSRCADAQAAAGHAADAVGNARAAWIAGLSEPTAEAQFAQHWGASLTPDDHWQRFLHLSVASPGDAGRQALRLDAPHRQAAEALLALRRDDARADALYAALTPDQQNDQAVMLEQARHLRRGGLDADALTLWTKSGATAQSAAPASQIGAFWAERATLARLLLRDGNDAGAYAVASGYDPTGHGTFGGEVVVDAEFLSGWIALRRLHDAASATTHFKRLAAVSTAAITQGRAHYWLARAAAARGDAAEAKAEYARAAQWPTTFYGQLAVLAAGDGSAALYADIKALHDPAWAPEQALDFAGREVARAAALLVAWGDAPRARPFLLRLVELAPDPADSALAARLATGLGMTDQAVMIARRAGLQGLMLTQSGWPTPYDPPTGLVEPAISLGLIRQESSFDAMATSSSGARGLMQLMPGTARQVARQAGGSDFAALSGDPAENMRLGVFYLRGLLDQFDDILPLAVAAYNAGPNRVQQWLGQNGDPRVPATAAIGGASDMIDWIELIPFNETRNYVQRVIENVVVYRARLGETTPHPLAKWLG